MQQHNDNDNDNDSRLLFVTMPPTNTGTRSTKLIALSLDGVQYTGESAIDVIAHMREHSRAPGHNIDHYIAMFAKRVHILRPHIAIRTYTPEIFLDDLNREGIVKVIR